MLATVINLLNRITPTDALPWSPAAMAIVYLPPVLILLAIGWCLIAYMVDRPHARPKNWLTPPYAHAKSNFETYVDAFDDEVAS